MTVKHNKREADTAAGIAGLQTSSSPWYLRDLPAARHLCGGGCRLMKQDIGATLS